jgi:hypothetical protein
MLRIRLLGPVIAVTLVLSAAMAPLSAAAVPRGFVGMFAGPPLFPHSDPTVNVTSQLGLMVSSGVESMRVAVDWASMQPYRNWSAVPSAEKARFRTDGVDRVPTQFGPLDALVGAAAQRGLTVLPTVLNAPNWDGKHRTKYLAIPSSNGPYGKFLKALVLRYGPHGTFWKVHAPKVPIRMWQIWNEPNERGLWPIQPFARSYVALVRTARAAIKSADPGAKIVLAGLSNYSWTYLAQIYRVRGARQLFDVVGVHPYTKEPQGVITILDNVRQVMRSHGDRRKPLDADEVGWPSSVGQTSFTYGFETTEAGQASNITALLPLLAKNRVRLGLLGFYYYTWAGVEHPGAYTFDFSGLLRFSSGQFVQKPGFSAFGSAALKLEGCRSKAIATRCLT